MRTSSGKKLGARESSEGKMRLTSKNLRSDKEVARRRAEIKINTYDDLKYQPVELFANCVDNIIDILAFRAGGFEFSIEN